jgi:uncharacterized protein (DUF983 family)
MHAETSPVFYETLPQPDKAAPRRPVFPAIRKGLRKRCPNCGKGRMFASYLKVNSECPACGEDLSHQRADDAPPYLTIVVVGHIIVPLILFVETRWHLSTVLHLSIWLPLTLLLSLLLLPMMKGAVVGLQWAMRMHGFDETDRSLPDPAMGFGTAELDESIAVSDP